MQTQNERTLKAIEQELARHAKDIEDVLDKSTEEERETTPEEREAMEKSLKALKELKERRADVQESIAVEQEVKEVSRKFGKSEIVVSDARVGTEPGDRLIQSVESIGEQFVNSAGYKAISNESERGQTFTSGPVEITFGNKGTLLEGAGGGGGALAATVPQVVPGVVDKMFQRLTVADLLLSGQATTSSLRYVVEGTATSGAAGVAEGGAKPESTLGLTTTDEPIKKIATVLVVSDEMLEDAAQVQSYINGRLSLFIQIEEERQLLRGAGTNDLVGIMAAARAINVYGGGTAAGSKAEQLFKAMNGQRGSALIEPDWVVINPTDWEAIRLGKDTAGQYFGGGPFQGPYSGTGSNLNASNQVTGADEFIWNKPVIVTSALGSGTALIGTRSAAQVYRRSGLSVEATNSHSTYFTSNLVAIRAEERLGLAVYRPAAFTDVRLA